VPITVFVVVSIITILELAPIYSLFVFVFKAAPNGALPAGNGIVATMALVTVFITRTTLSFIVGAYSKLPV
jgi:hypothetical protein